MKVYKITLYVSIVLFFVFAILSIILNCLNYNGWISFSINWCVGIACSLAVVIITTLVQFKVEQERAINKLASILEVMFFHNAFSGGVFSINIVRNKETVKDLDIMENNWRISLEEDNRKLYLVLADLEFFFDNKTFLNLFKLCNAFSISTFDKTENDYEREARLLKNEYQKTTEKIIKMAEMVIKLKPNKHEREILEKHIAYYRNKW